MLETLEGRFLLASNLLLDSGFESVPVGSSSYFSFAYRPQGTPWIFSGYSGLSGNQSGFTSGNPSSPEDSQVLVLQMDGVVSQAFDVPVVGTYALNFLAAQRGNWNQGTQVFQVLLDGNVVASVQPSGTDYLPITAGRLELAAGQHVLTFKGRDVLVGDTTALVDAVRLEPVTVVLPNTVTVGTRQELISSLESATPGTTVAILPGNYPGDIQVAGLQGTADARITITAADPTNPPVIGNGSGEGLKLSDIQYVNITNLTIFANQFNGLNIDDGGTFDTPSRFVSIDRVTVQATGDGGISNAIKVSGVDDLTITNCWIQNWGAGGSGVDMVGCHRVLIAANSFIDNRFDADDGLQAKGGSSDIEVWGNAFSDAGARAVQIGGSAADGVFRPPGETWEVQRMAVHHNLIVGSEAAVAFTSNGPGCSFTNNTVVNPAVWFARLLLENSSSPPQGGQIDKNLIVYPGPTGIDSVNVGAGTDPSLLIFGDNFWAGSQEGLFVDPANWDYHLRPGSPAVGYGAF